MSPAPHSDTTIRPTLHGTKEARYLQVPRREWKDSVTLGYSSLVAVMECPRIEWRVGEEVRLILLSLTGCHVPKHVLNIKPVESACDVSVPRL